MKANNSCVQMIRKIASKKRLTLLLSMILIFTFVVGGTLAYLFVTVGPITNIFEPANVSCTVSDDQTQVTSNSDTRVWLRVSFTVVYRSTSDTNAINSMNPAFTVSNDGAWTQFGDYYYYNTAVAAGGAVSLPTVTVTGGSLVGLTVEKQVHAEVIQSAPLDAVQEAWGMTRSGENWQTYTP